MNPHVDCHRGGGGGGILCFAVGLHWSYERP